MLEEHSADKVRIMTIMLNRLISSRLFGWQTLTFGVGKGEMGYILIDLALNLTSGRQQDRKLRNLTQLQHDYKQDY